MLSLGERLFDLEPGDCSRPRDPELADAYLSVPAPSLYIFLVSLYMSISLAFTFKFDDLTISFKTSTSAFFSLT